MTYGVFIHRQDSIYKDTPAERYHFPAQYLGRVRTCMGDWILYYGPRKATEVRGYFAIAKIERVIADPDARGMYFAIIEPGTYLEFAQPVPFSDAEGIIEQGLLNNLGRISGRAQSAVRPISPADFHRIVGLATAENGQLLPRVDRATAPSFRESQTPLVFEQDRETTAYLMSRVLRDRVFRRVVLNAYYERCAVTGLKLINGGGRAEVAAAHIRPVEANGPDIVSNGIALSGTAHWMFDRGLISLSDDLQILISRQVNDRETIEGFINKSGRAYAPSRVHERPHPHFLQWHRENCFKQ